MCLGRLKIVGGVLIFGIGRTEKPLYVYKAFSGVHVSTRPDIQHISVILAINGKYSYKYSGNKSCYWLSLLIVFFVVYLLPVILLFKL